MKLFPEQCKKIKGFLNCENEVKTIEVVLLILYLGQYGHFVSYLWVGGAETPNMSWTSSKKFHTSVQNLPISESYRYF